MPAVEGIEDLLTERLAASQQGASRLHRLLLISHISRVVPATTSMLVGRARQLTTANAGDSIHSWIISQQDTPSELHFVMLNDNLMRDHTHYEIWEYC